jgi:hypothetical protein
MLFSARQLSFDDHHLIDTAIVDFSLDLKAISYARTRYHLILANRLKKLTGQSSRRGRGTDFAIQPSGSIDRKYMVETLTSMVV